MRGSTKAMVSPAAFKESIINFESPSRTASVRPNSCPNSIACVAATASISTGRSAGEKLWVKDASMALVLSRPQCLYRFYSHPWKLLHQNLFWLNLHQDSGGFHFPFGFGAAWGMGGSTATNSANFSFACDVSWSEVQHGQRFWPWFRWCQIPQVIIIKSSWLPWFLSIHDSS